MKSDRLFRQYDDETLRMGPKRKRWRRYGKPVAPPEPPKPSPITPAQQAFADRLMGKKR